MSKAFKDSRGSNLVTLMTMMAVVVVGGVCGVFVVVVVVGTFSGCRSSIRVFIKSKPMLYCHYE